jgi:hypothetical protein
MGKITQFVTFEIELLLLTFTVSTTIWLMSAYLNSTLKIPPMVFMFVGSICSMALVTLAAQVFVFSTRFKINGGPLGDTVLSQVCQGFAVVSSVMWIGLILIMFIDVPRISSIPEFEPAASLISASIVIGFTFLIPFLALVVCYTALPEDAHNSLLFNGSTVGAFSLLFFVVVSFGSAGVTKCDPFSGVFTNLIFFVLVWVYFGVLYLVEIANFFKWNPLKMFQSGAGNNAAQVSNSTKPKGGILGLGRAIESVLGFNHKINYWRIPGCILNGAIILSTIPFSSSHVHVTVGVVFVIVMVAHIFLIVNVDVGGATTFEVPSADTDEVPSAELETMDDNFPMKSTYQYARTPSQPALQYRANPVPPPGYRAPAAGYQAPVAGYQAPVAGYKAPVAGYQAPQGAQAVHPVPAHPTAPVPAHPVPAHPMAPVAATTANVFGGTSPFTDNYFGANASYGNGLALRLDTNQVDTTGHKAVHGPKSVTASSLPRQRRGGANADMFFG